MSGQVSWICILCKKAYAAVEYLLKHQKNRLNALFAGGFLMQKLALAFELKHVLKWSGELNYAKNANKSGL